MARPSPAALLVLCLLAGGCAGGAGESAGGPSPRGRLATALEKTRHAGSARVAEYVVSEPRDLEWRLAGRTRFDYNDALIDIVHLRHPDLAPGTTFHVRIADIPYVRRTNGSWYSPPYHTGEFELGYANFIHLVTRAYGRVESEGPRRLLVWMSRGRLERLRTSPAGMVGPLGTLYDLRGPMRVDLDAKGRIERIKYTVSGRYYFALTPSHRVTVTNEFSHFRRHFDVTPPPGGEITSGPLVPPQPGARAEMSRL